MLRERAAAWASRDDTHIAAVRFISPHSCATDQPYSLDDDCGARKRGVEAREAWFLPLARSGVGWDGKRHRGSHGENVISR